MALQDVQDLTRYARQIRLPQVGPAGQAKLAQASVLIVGAGGLGSPAAMYLAAAGVGRIGIADGDRVDATNLHRQLLHGTSDVGVAKVESARATLGDINPTIRVDAIAERLDRHNALEIVAQYDLVIDGTDNFATRYLLNDACVLTGRPLVSGSIDRFEGQVSVFGVEGGPCYRCLFPEPPEPGTVLNCADAGVLGVLPGIVGTLQATEALKLILGIGDSLVGRLLLLDTLSMRFRTVAVDPDPACPMCGTHEITALVDYDAFCAGGASASQPVGAGAAPAAPGSIMPAALAQELAHAHAITLIDVREPHEWQVARIPGARLIPLGTVERAAATLDPAADVVVYCHHGMRSQMAANLLVAAGFERVRNLTGGIDRWSVEVDPSVPRY